jgi:hypothetical protein
MKRLLVNVTAAIIGAVGLSGTALADTRSPHAQTFVLSCGGASVTFVSPVEQARAAQIVGTTGAGILQRVVFSGTVLFEQPSFQALKPSALTTCTQPVPGGEVTLIVLVTPQD